LKTAYFQAEMTISLRLSIVVALNMESFD
jgi:hypothetical protein